MAFVLPAIIAGGAAMTLMMNMSMSVIPAASVKNYGTMTPPGVLIAHVIFGLALGLVYAWLV